MVRIARKEEGRMQKAELPSCEAPSPFLHFAFCLLPFRPADKPPEYALNREVGRRNQVRVTRVLRLQIRLAVFANERLERAFPVNERRDDLAVPRLRAMLQNHPVTVANVLADHRIAARDQGEGAARPGDAEGFQVDGNGALRQWLEVLRETRRNRTEDRHRHHPPAESAQRRHRPPGAGLARLAHQIPLANQRGDVVRHGARAAETEVPANFLPAWAELARAQLLVDEGENPALLVRKLDHNYPN